MTSELLISCFLFGLGWEPQLLGAFFLSLVAYLRNLHMVFTPYIIRLFNYHGYNNFTLTLEDWSGPLLTVAQVLLDWLLGDVPKPLLLGFLVPVLLINFYFRWRPLTRLKTIMT